MTKPSVPTTENSNTKASTKDKLLRGLFVSGLASIFLVNVVNAIVDPDSFIKLLSPNIFVPTFLPPPVLVGIASVSDLTTWVLILLASWLPSCKRKKAWIYAWAGLWFLVVTTTKIGYFLS